MTCTFQRDGACVQEGCFWPSSTCYMQSAAEALASEFVMERLVDDLRIASRAIRGSSWPLDMAEDMEQRANRLTWAADLLNKGIR